MKQLKITLALLVLTVLFTSVIFAQDNKEKPGNAPATLQPKQNTEHAGCSSTCLNEETEAACKGIESKDLNISNADKHCAGMEKDSIDCKKKNSKMECKDHESGKACVCKKGKSCHGHKKASAQCKENNVKAACKSHESGKSCTHEADKFCPDQKIDSVKCKLKHDKANKSGSK